MKISKTPARKFAATVAFILAAAGLLSHPACGTRNRPNVLLIVVDTLRADRLGCYGWKENTTPNIDRLAGEGVLVERMMSQVPQTLPSFCTILTGTYPVTHGVRVNGLFALSPSARTLAEVFEDEGYETAAFIAGFPLDSMFGLDQGFATYEDSMRSHQPFPQKGRGEKDPIHWLGFTTECFENTADVITGEAAAWLQKEGRSGPFFMMAHYFDPHSTYAPPERFREAFPHPYSGEVAFADEQVGKLLDTLDGLGLAKNTLVVLTADHGECLGEQSRFYHQGWLVEATLHVPFAARMPGVLPAGKRVKGLCRLADVMPTILDLAKIPVPGTVEGKSLVEAFRTGSTEGAFSYFETLYGKLEKKKGVTRQGVIAGNWKYIHNTREDPVTGQRDEADQLYDLTEDPEEIHNEAARLPGEVRRCRALLEKFLKDHPAGRAVIVTPDESSLRKLKSLGYF